MSDTERFDAIIIGSGQAANPLAKALAKAGKRTAVIESTHVGGTCVNEGCTPTKTMVASGRVAYLARRGASYGVTTGPISIDMERIRERKRAIVTSFREGSERSLQASDCDTLILGEASFAGPKQVKVAVHGEGERLLTSELIFINTGLRSRVPEIDGLSDVNYLDNRSVMELASVPKHLIVLGGGYIGLEFGQLFRRLGSAVTIIQSAAKLLTREDDDIADEVHKIIVEDGIQVLLQTSATRVAKAGESICVTVKSGSGGEQTVAGSHLLLAAGRIPNTERLNLPAAGVKVDDHGFIQTNEYLETSAPGIYALGDVKGGPAFTHISYDDYRVAAANTLDGKRASIAGRMVPYTVFIDPQLGRIGVTEAEARKSGKQIKIAKMPASSIARALEIDETRGLMKVIVDRETDEILGAAVLATEGGEMASMLQIAMMGKLSYKTLRDGIWSHPTWSEALNTVFSKFED